MKPTRKNLRQHERHPTENCIMVNNDGVFQLVDIGNGGFSFKCPSNADIPDEWVAYILTPIGDLKEYIAEKKWTAGYEDGHSHLPPITKVGAKFGQLAKKQITHLAELISAISDMPAESSKYYL